LIFAIFSACSTQYAVHNVFAAAALCSLQNAVRNLQFAVSILLLPPPLPPLLLLVVLVVVKGGEMTFYGKPISELRSVTRLNPKQGSWYSIYLPRRDGRLS